MFFKRTGKINLAENFEEAKKVGKEMLTLLGNLGGEDNKTLMINKKNSFID